MRLRVIQYIEEATGRMLSATYAVIDWDDFALMLKVPGTMLESRDGCNEIARHLWRMRKEIRTTRTTRQPPSGSLH
jgi:hypothetical protein